MRFKSYRLMFIRLVKPKIEISIFKLFLILKWGAPFSSYVHTKKEYTLSLYNHLGIYIKYK